MKKRLFALLLSLALVLPLCPAANAQEEQTVVVMRLGCARMAVDDRLRPVDELNGAVLPFAENDRTLVPVSRVVDAFGGESGWDPDTNDVWFALGGHLVANTIGEDVILVDGEEVRMDVPSRALHDRTYVPLRAVLEGLGLVVSYDHAYQLVVISREAVDTATLPLLPGAQALLATLSPQESLAGVTPVSPPLSAVELTADLTQLSNVLLPDFGAATGYRFTSDSDPNRRTGTTVTYSLDSAGYDDEATSALVLEAVEEYFDLLASLPCFEVAEEINLTWGFYSGGLRYVGTGEVKTGSLYTFNGHTPCDICFRVDGANCQRVTWDLARGFQLGNTGHRVTLGEGAPSPALLGPHARDGYYRSGDVYYNGSDRTLAVTSGRAAFLINGQPYEGQVDFHTEYADKPWAVDLLTVNAFHRSDWLEVAFPMNYPLSGDFYTANDFRRWAVADTTTDREQLWAFAMSNLNGIAPAMPLASDSNIYEAVNVRILQWDKTGDTVLYLYAKLTLAGKSYELEGLLAAPHRVASPQEDG